MEKGVVLLLRGIKVYGRLVLGGGVECMCGWFDLMGWDGREVVCMCVCMYGLFSGGLFVCLLGGMDGWMLKTRGGCIDPTEQLEEKENKLHIYA